MKTNHLFVGYGIAAGVLLAAGCGGMDASGAAEETGQASASLETAGVTAPAADEKAQAQAQTRGLLSAYSAQRIPQGKTYHRALFPTYYRNPGDYIIATTSNPVPADTDPVCVIFQRCDNGTGAPDSTGNAKICAGTLGVDDDGGGGRMSRVSYTLPTGTWPSINAWLMCFAYCYSSGTGCKTGRVDVTVDWKVGSSTGTFLETQVAIASGGIPAVSTAGRAYESAPSPAGLNPILLVFTQTAGQPYDGGWNDNAPGGCPVGGVLPCYQGLTNHPVWLVSDVWNRATTGSAVVNW